jgi:hypothetical protein
LGRNPKFKTGEPNFAIQADFYAKFLCPIFKCLKKVPPNIPGKPCAFLLGKARQTM